MEFSMTEELSTLMPMKGTTKGADLYKEMKKMMQSLDIPTQ
jgi:hypothetical protein